MGNLTRAAIAAWVESQNALIDTQIEDENKGICISATINFRPSPFEFMDAINHVPDLVAREDLA